jgi:ACT domain-containing protein
MMPQRNPLPKESKIIPARGIPMQTTILDLVKELARTQKRCKELELNLATIQQQSSAKDACQTQQEKNDESILCTIYSCHYL